MVKCKVLNKMKFCNQNLPLYILNLQVEEVFNKKYKNVLDVMYLYKHILEKHLLKRYPPKHMKILEKYVRVRENDFASISLNTNIDEYRLNFKELAPLTMPIYDFSPTGEEYGKRSFTASQLGINEDLFAKNYERYLKYVKTIYLFEQNIISDFNAFNCRYESKEEFMHNIKCNCKSVYGISYARFKKAVKMSDEHGDKNPLVLNLNPGLLM